MKDKTNEQTQTETQAETEAQKGQAVQLELPLDGQKTVVRPTQAETNYVTISPQLVNQVACQNCRWFVEDGEYGSTCHIIENGPQNVVGTGWCDRYDGPVVAEQTALEPFPTLVVGDSPALETEERAATPEPDKIIYATPDDGGGFLKGLRHKVSGGLKPGTTVLKDARGRRYMLVVTSNSYQDREQETITTDALKSSVDAGWVADDQYLSDNPLLYWHDDRLKIGNIVWADVRGPFLVELAKEAPGIVAEEVFDYYETTEEKSGASHKFAYYTKRREADGTYTQIFKQETSILPREAAANIGTYTGVFPMTDERGKHFNKVLGLENASDLLDENLDKLVEALTARGIEHKSKDDPDATEQVEKATDKFAPLLLQLIDSQAGLAEEVDTVMTKSKALVDERDSQADIIKALTGRLDNIEARLGARPTQASRDEGNIIDDASELSPAIIKAIEAASKPAGNWWGGSDQKDGNS